MTRELFLELTKAEQDEHTEAAKREHEEATAQWKLKMGGTPATDPQSRQK